MFLGLEKIPRVERAAHPPAKCLNSFPPRILELFYIFATRTAIPPSPIASSVPDVIFF